MQLNQSVLIYILQKNEIFSAFSLKIQRAFLIINLQNMYEY